MFKKRVFGILLIFFACGFVYPVQSKHANWQKMTLEEMKNTLKNGLNPKSRIDLMNLMAYKLKDYNYKEAEEYASGAREQSELYYYNMGWVDSMNILGDIYLRGGKTGDAYEMFHRAREASVNNDQFYRIGEMEALLGFCRYFQAMGELDRAFLGLMDVQRLFDDLNEDDDGLSDRVRANFLHAFGTIALFDIFRDQNWENIIGYFLKSLEIREKIGNKDEIAIGYCSLGDVFQIFGNFPKAELNLNKAESMNIHIKNKYVQARIIRGRGAVLIRDSKNSEKAKDKFLQSQRIIDEIGDVFQSISLGVEIGKCLYETKKYEEAETWNTRWLGKAQEFQDANGIRSLVENLKKLIEIKMEKKRTRGNEMSYEESMIELDGYLSNYEEYADIIRKHKLRKGEFSGISVFSKLIHDERQKSQQLFLIIILVLAFIGLGIAFFAIVSRIRAKNLKILLEKEKENSNLKDVWMYTLAHEYKTPLAAIKMACDNLDKFFSRMHPSEIIERISSINISVAKLESLIKKIMELSREFKPKQQNLGEICGDIISAHLKNNNVMHKILFNYPGEVILANVDKDLIKIILDNLLSNAVKYSESDTEVNVNLKLKKNYVVLTVSDHGRGIPDEYLKQKDKRFLRANNVQKIEGTGLGLSIVERNVSLHGGKLQITSVLNKGTMVSIEFPVMKTTNSRR